VVLAALGSAPTAVLGFFPLTLMRPGARKEYALVLGPPGMAELGAAAELGDFDAYGEGGGGEQGGVTAADAAGGDSGAVEEAPCRAGGAITVDLCQEPHAAAGQLPDPGPWLRR
jgi:hypothetical protein